jgi:hypothetical protein
VGLEQGLPRRPAAARDHPDLGAARPAGTHRRRRALRGVAPVRGREQTARQPRAVVAAAARAPLLRPATPGHRERDRRCVARPAALDALAPVPVGARRARRRAGWSSGGGPSPRAGVPARSARPRLAARASARGPPAARAGDVGREPAAPLARAAGRRARPLAQAPHDRGDRLPSLEHGDEGGPAAAGRGLLREVRHQVRRRARALRRDRRARGGAARRVERGVGDLRAARAPHRRTRGSAASRSSRRSTSASRSTAASVPPTTRRCSTTSCASRR